MRRGRVLMSGVRRTHLVWVIPSRRAPVGIEMGPDVPGFGQAPNGAAHP